MLTLAHQRLLTPKWSEQVLDEVKRNRPDGVTAERIYSRFAQMNKVFPAAMTSGYEGLMSDMQADEKDKHVLAAAVHSGATVLVTDNTKDFRPPSTGPNAIKVERISDFLNRLLAKTPDRVVAAMESMVKRNRREPRTMPDLIDKMATQQDLQGFAQKLNSVVGLEHRGTNPNLTGGADKSAKAVALDGMTPATGAAPAPTGSPEARRIQQRLEKGKGAERDV